jgi:hypothetical protein
MASNQQKFSKVSIRGDRCKAWIELAKLYDARRYFRSAIPRKVVKYMEVISLCVLIIIMLELGLVILRLGSKS